MTKPTKTPLTGCNDLGCLVAKPVGQHTNGGKCYCPDYKIARRIRELELALAAANERAEKAEATNRSLRNDLANPPGDVQERVLAMHESQLPQARKGEPMEANNDEVICPNCVHQFRAIPVNVQCELAATREDAERYRWLRERFGEDKGKLLDAAIDKARKG